MRTGWRCGAASTPGSTSNPALCQDLVLVLQPALTNRCPRWEPEAGAREGEGRKKTVTFAGSHLVASPSADSLGSALRCIITRSSSV
jgi:hypothetical protein